MSEELPAYHAANQDRARASARVVVRGIGLNLGLAAAKFAGGAFGHSYALFADGAESLLDVIASLLAWAGFQVAGRPPDSNHPFGHGKAESVAALVEAAAAFPCAGWIAWHAIEAIQIPRPGPRWPTLPLLAAVIAVKAWFSRRVKAAGRKAGSTALSVEAWRHWSDALTSAAAFIGIGIALLGGPKWVAADGWAALFACAIIASNGAAIVNQALGEIMDIAVSPKFEGEVRALAANVPGVQALDKCRVRKSGLSNLVDIQIRVDGNLAVREGHAIAHAVKGALLASPLRITDVSVHVEPTK